MKLHYSTIRSVFSFFHLNTDQYCGVAGDGGNAAYEWFVYRDGKLEISDCGYGDTMAALRDVLTREVPPPK